MEEKLIYNVGVKGTQEIDNLEKSVKKTGTTTNKTTSYMSELRRELRDMRGEMIKNEQGSEAYNRALRRGAQITGQINDANSKMKMGIMDLGQTTKNITSSITGFAGGFQVVQASMQLFGIENENAIKSIQRLQQTMAIIQGMAAFAQGINDVQNLMANFRAESDLVKGTIGELGEVQSKTATSTSNLGKESAVLSTNLAGNQAVADNVAKSMDNLKLTYGDGTITTDAYALSQYKLDLALIKSGEDFDNLSFVTEGYLRRTNQLNLSEEELIATIEEQIKRTQKILIIREKELAVKKTYNKLLAEGKSKQEAYAGAVEEGKIILDKYKDSNIDLSDEQEKLNINLGKGGKSVESFIGSIGKSLLTMGVFLAIIGAISYAITKLIEALNTIPKTLEIKLELNDDAMKNLVSDIDKARLFAIKYNRAVQDGDNKKILALRKIGREEYGLDKKRLKAIGENMQAWRVAFKDYLDVAKVTYYNAALSKKKAEAEVEREVEKQAVDLASKALQFRESDKGAIGYKLETEALKKELNNRIEAYNDANKKIAELNKVAFKKHRDLVLPEKEEELNITTTAVGAIDVTDPLGRKRPDSVEKDKEIEFLKAKLLTKEGLNEQELEMLAEYNRKYDTLQSDSELRYTEHLIRMGEARAKDLDREKVALENSINDKKSSFEADKQLINQNLVEQTNLHNLELEQLRQFNKVKFDIEEEFGELSKKKDKTAEDKERLEALRNQYELVTDTIDKTKESVDAYKEKITEIENEIQTLEAVPEEIKRLEEDLDRLNLAIAENSAATVNAMAMNTQAMLDNVQTYVTAMGQAFDGLQSMSDDMLRAKDNELAKDKNRLELTQAYREADAYDQEMMMYELELANYESKKKMFEADKAFKIGQVSITGIQNQMDILANHLDPSTGAPWSPWKIAKTALATAGNIAATVGSIAEIKSTSLEQPVPPTKGDKGSTGGGGGSQMQVALNPNRSGLTSREENLNMMYQAGKDIPSENVVKVSDINNVQNKVNVREKNSSY